MQAWMSAFSPLSGVYGCVCVSVSFSVDALKTMENRGTGAAIADNYGVQTRLYLPFFTKDQLY